jgi:hypothetical protein
MNQLIVAEKLTDWQRLKALVLDSVSSPITHRMYNQALDEFMAWFQQLVEAGLHEGRGQRLARIAGGPRPEFVLRQRAPVGHSQAGGGSS